MKTDTANVRSAYARFCARRFLSIEASLVEARSLAEMMDLALAVESNAGTSGDLMELRTLLVVDIAELKGFLARLQRQRGRRASCDKWAED